MYDFSTQHFHLSDISFCEMFCFIHFVRFGTVVGCKIVEVPTAADDCAVRIFLHFEDIDGAQKAQKDLNGRYFGGRVVRCSFYPEHRFFGGDLHPGLDE
jgi:hypothetical protein